MTPLLGRVRSRFRRRRELPADFYDDLFLSVEHYTVPYRESWYYPMWEDLVARALPTRRILEIGCGTGQLAQMLHESGAEAYVGFDFSPAAVEIAQRTNPALEFHVADAKTTPLLDELDYDLVVCTEVLEHIEDDLAIVRRIRPGARLLATVPDYDSESHVRFFGSAEEVRDRYAPLLAPFEVHERRMSERARLFLLDGIRAAPPETT